MKNKIRIAIYSRKSKYTDKGDSIGNQIELAREYINTHYPSDKYDVEIKEYEDEGFSGGNIDRPHFQEFLKDQNKNPYDVLICYRLDRISRNIADFSKLMEELTTVNTSFVSIKEQFDTKTPMGRAMMYIASVFAQLEREVIAERVRDNMLELAKTGRWLGGDTPTGFKAERYEIVQVCEKDEKSEEIVGSKTRKACKLVTDEEEKELILHLCNKYLELKSLSQLEHYCLVNNIKTKNGKEFGIFSLKTILTNPVYVKNDQEVLKYFKEKGIHIYAEPDGRDKFDGKYGLLAYNKKSGNIKQMKLEDWIIAVGLHEGFLSGEKWVKIQRIIEENSKNMRFRATSSSYSKNDVIFSGILRCGECHSKMIIMSTGNNLKNGERRYYYKCENKTKSKRLFCNGYNISGKDLDNSVSDILKSVFVPNSEVYKELQKMVLSKNTTDTTSEIVLLNAKINKNNQEIKKLVEKLKFLDIEVIDVVNDAIKELKNDNQEIKLKINQLENKKESKKYQTETAKFILNIINNCFDVYDSLTLKDKKDILNMFLEEATVTNKNTVELKFLNTKLNEETKKWYYNNQLNKKENQTNFNKTEKIIKTNIKVNARSEDILNIFQHIRDKGILNEPLKYDISQRKFITDNHKKEMNFIDYVKEYRRNRKLSQREVAEKLKIDEDVYARYERKKLIVKSPELVDNLIDILEMDKSKIKIPEYVEFLRSNPNERIRKYIKENNITYKKFAKLAKVHEKTVSRWIKNKSDVSLKEFHNVMKLLDGKIDLKYKSKDDEMEI